MNPLLTSIAAVLRRRWVRHHGRPLRDARRLPLWRLLRDEAVYATGRAVRPPWRWMSISVIVVAVGVMLGFAEVTPGPVVSVGWRAVAAVTAAVLAGVVVRRWPDRRDG